jgi:hypothetical protein
MDGINLVPPPLEALLTPNDGVLTSYIPYAILLLAISVFMLVSLSVYWNKKNFTAIPLSLILLLSPFVSVANAVDYGVPLTTTGIALFAYYKEPTGFNLLSVIGAYSTYILHGSYIDGTVKVWCDGSKNNFTGTNYYMNVSMRVRSDGWILAWTNATQDVKNNLYPNSTVALLSPMTEYMDVYYTSEERAMQQAFYLAGKTMPNLDDIWYYDYHYPSATRLIILSMSYSWSTISAKTTYISIPSGTIYCAKLVYGASTGSGAWSTHLNLYWDSTLLESIGAGATVMWETYTPSVSVGTEYYFRADHTADAREVDAKMVFMVWL